VIHESMSLKYEPSSEPLHIHRVHAHLDHDVGARPVHLIITMIKWIRTGRLSIKNSLSYRVHAHLDHDLSGEVVDVFIFFINLQPLKKRSTTKYTPFALDREPDSLTDILRPS